MAVVLGGGSNWLALVMQTKKIEPTREFPRLYLCSTLRPVILMTGVLYNGPAYGDI